MTKGMSWDELEARCDLHERLAEAAVKVLADHVPQIAEEETWAAAFDIAEPIAWYRDGDRLPGGAEDRAALVRYIRARWALRAAFHALPLRLRGKLGFDADADRRSEIASLKFLRDLPRYPDKTNMLAVHAVASARAVWSEAHGKPAETWGALELDGPTTSHAAFADFLQALLEALEIEGVRPGTVADAKSAYQAFVRYTGKRGPGGGFPMDDGL
jgi:hypothetical protein